MKRYAVQIRIDGWPIGVAFIHVLHTAGLIELITPDVIRIEAPDRVDTKIWATAIAQHAKSMGFKAEVVVSDRIN